MSVKFSTGLPPGPQLQLPVCADCGHVNYPVRELCGSCLADALAWEPVSDEGTVQSLTQVHYSLEPAYAEHSPWPVASIKLGCGPIAFAHLQPGLEVGAAVCISILADSTGNRMLVAHLPGDSAAATWLQTIHFEEAGL